MWEFKFIPEAEKDFKSMDNFSKEIIMAGLLNVAQNPLPNNEGGYGKPLGNKKGKNLTNFFKIKYKSINIRVVYTLVRTENVFNIIAVVTRNDDECYDIASFRKNKHGKDLFRDIFE